MTTKQHHPNGFLRLPAVLELLQISKSSLYSGIKTDKYPSPIKLSERTSVWHASTIYDFIDSFHSKSHIDVK